MLIFEYCLQLVILFKHLVRVSFAGLPLDFFENGFEFSCDSVLLWLKLAEQIR